MKIANIYPVANQVLYKNEDYVMILAHLLKYYKSENFNDKSYIIIDNGLYEETQVSTDLKKIVNMVECSNIRVNEIIIPDVVNDTEATIELFLKNIKIINEYTNKYNFMFVAQATTLEEFRRAISFINSYKETIPNLTIGVSKLTPLDRTSNELIEILKTALYPIHYLGLKESFDEIDKVKYIIRGCDSSQLAYIAKNETNTPTDIYHYKRKGRREDGRGIEGIDIDLEKDKLNNFQLIMLKTMLPPLRTLLEVYQDFVREGASSKYDSKLAIIGLVGEVGELADVVKKEAIYEDMSKFTEKYGMSVREKIIDEAGDVMWQLTLILEKYNLTIGEIIKQNISKLQNRHGKELLKKDGGIR